MQNSEMVDLASNKRMNKQTLLNTLRSVNCTILKKGYRKSLNDYIFCSCDPDLQEPICQECFELCHSGHSIKMRRKLHTICSCGSKSHQMNITTHSQEDKLNSSFCPMMEWNYTINSEFYYCNRENKKLCLFCANFCESNFKELMKQRLRRNNNQATLSNPETIINCECNNKNHLDVKIILKKIRDCVNLKYFFFENISKTHFLNMILKSENTFNQMFFNFKHFYDKLKNKIDAFAVNLNKNSNIICSNFSHDNNLTEAHIATLFNLYLSILATLSEQCNRLNYFSDKISTDFNLNYLINLMNMKTEYKSVNIWNFKLNLISIFLNVHFKKDLAIVPNMRVKDLELLNPWQRLIYINNIKVQNEIMSKYINNLKFNFLEFAIKSLFSLNAVRDKVQLSYKLMRKFFNICKTYAKFNLFNYDQAIKYSLLIDEVIQKISVQIKSLATDNSIKEVILEEQILLIKPIIKSLIYLSYYYNDQLAEKFLNKNFLNKDETNNKKNKNKLKFFNSNLELTKFISKNCINCLTNILNNSVSIKLEKETNEIISNISALLKIFIDTKDSYSTGLKRIYHRNNIIPFNYMTDNLTQSENHLVNELRSLTNDIEKCYLLFFNFELDEKNLCENLKASIKKVFDLMNLSNYRQVNLLTQNMPSSFNESGAEFNNFKYVVLTQTPERLSVFPQQKTINRNTTKKELLEENNNVSLNDKNNDNQEEYLIRNYDLISQYKILINNSFIIFTVVKVIKIFYENFCNSNNEIENQNLKAKYDKDINIILEKKEISKSNDKQIFIVENNLFEEIVKLLHFYIENNPDNCIILLSSDFLETFSLLNNKQLNEILGLIYLVFKYIVKVKYELANSDSILKFLKNLIKKIDLHPENFNSDFRIFLKILKLVKVITKLNFMNEALVSNKLRKFTIKIFEKFNVITQFINFLREPRRRGANTSEFETDMISDNDNLRIKMKNGNVRKTNTNTLILIDEEEKSESNQETPKDHKNKNNFNLIDDRILIETNSKENKDQVNILNVDFEFNNSEDFNEVEINGMKVRDLTNILRYFLAITNILFDGDATLNQKEYLSRILDSNDVFKILKIKYIEISLRKEIVTFFRMVYIDVIFEKNRIEDYLYVILDKKTQDNNVNLKENMLNNGELNKLYNFINKLININKNSSNLDLEYEVIKHELIFHQEILEKNKDAPDIYKLEYLVDAIIQPIKTFMEKFLSRLNSFSGNDYLKLYEIVLYFLFLKNRIVNEENYKRSLKTRYEFQDIFNISTLKAVERFLPIKKDFSQQEIEDLRNDIDVLKNANFEFYQYEFLIGIYNKHMDNFVLSTKSESLKKEFMKKNSYYELEEINTLKQRLTQLNLLKTNYEKSAFNLIISYFNSKRNLAKSGFMNALEDTNLQFANTYRYLIVRSIFYILRDERFKDEHSRDCFWNLFKLIQYDTELVQKEITKLIKEPQDLVDLKDLNYVFLENFISIIFTSCNPTNSNLNQDYFLAMNIVKILKYLCEDHNKEFQKIFFKEINLLEIKTKRKDKFKPMLNTIPEERENANDSYIPSRSIPNSTKNVLKKNHNIDREKINDDLFNAKMNINSKFSGENSLFKNQVNAVQAEKPDQIKENKEFLSIFEFMLEVVNKMIIIAQWKTVEFNTDNINVGYYYDIFSTVVEFLIEMIQGTEGANLESLVYKKKDKYTDEETGLKIILFLNNIKSILLRDETDSIIVYQVRKDLIDFICAFLEEKSSPKKLIDSISNIINPYAIFNSIINTMKKLYIVYAFHDENGNSTSKKYSSITYKDIQFDRNMCQFFEQKYFANKSLSENIEFDLANRMFQYIKILATEYSNPDAIEIIKFADSKNLKNMKYNESSYHSKEVDTFNSSSIYNRNNNEPQAENANKIPFASQNDKMHLTMNANKDATLIFKNQTTKKQEEELYYITTDEKHFCIKFFEKITRIVIVQNNDELVRVVFTINPLLLKLSKNSKIEFYENVNRQTRYIKLFSLMEYCDYFYDEIIYNSRFSELNLIMKLINKINFYPLRLIAFTFNVAQNILMLSSLQFGEEDDGDVHITPIITILSIIKLIFCAMVTIIWFYSKFPLYWIIDSKKFVLKNNFEEGKKLSFRNKISVFNSVIFSRNEIISFIWHIIFSSIGLTNPYYHFVFSIEVLIIVNLSNILKNIVKSVTLRYKQLIVTFMLFLIFNYQFAVFALYFLSEDFETSFQILPGTGGEYENKTVIQNQCGTMLYCFITHLDYGLRSDGGIGEYIPKRSYNLDSGYYIGRFFHNLLYFIIVNVIIFSILMGIIIDTFAELREMMSKKEDDMANICYICGDSRENIEKKSTNFFKHITQEHSLWTYAEYIVGLKFVDPQETNAINSYVIGTLEQKAISWFPHVQGEGDEHDNDSDSESE